MIGGAAILTLCAVLLARWFPPAPFFGHMLGHMIIVALVPAILVVAACRRELHLRVRNASWFSPIVASMVEMVIVWAWHLPSLHHASASHLGIFVVEQIVFLGSGLYLWSSVAFANAGRPTFSGMLALLLTSVHMTLLGAAITFSSRLLYTHAGESPHHGSSESHARWLSALHDQQLGGATMIVVGTAVYLSAALWLAHKLISTSNEDT